MRRQRLGQHFLISKKIAQNIQNYAGIKKSDVVLEIGTGRGILIPFLCKNVSKVISIEKDKSLYEDAKAEFSEFENLVLIHGDGFKSKEKFSIFISNLPYSKSRKAMEWLMQKSFLRGIVMVQKEFAEKLVTDSKKERKAITILANHSFEIEILSKVGRNNFDPPPKIDSVILKLTPKKTIKKELIETVNLIFSYRRKTLHNIFEHFGLQNQSDKRLGDLDGDEIIKIAKKIIKK